MIRVKHSPAVERELRHIRRAQNSLRENECLIAQEPRRGERGEYHRLRPETIVEVRFAERSGRDAADDVIAGLVAEDTAPGSLEVVTSDAELARRVREHGAAVTGARGFLDLLSRARS